MQRTKHKFVSTSVGDLRSSFLICVSFNHVTEACHRGGFERYYQLP